MACFTMAFLNYRLTMGKSCKVVVCGLAAVGKTAVLEQLLYANHIAGRLAVIFACCYVTLYKNKG